jgi:hypothetical protein
MKILIFQVFYRGVFILFMACFENECISELVYHSELLRGLYFICSEILIIFLVAIYFNLVIPQNYGVPKHPLFCLFCCSWKSKNKEKYSSKEGISVINMRKEFKEKIALNDVSFEIKKGKLLMKLNIKMNVLDCLVKMVLVNLH